MSPVAKDPSWVVHLDQPLNAGPPLERLAASFYTPTELFFVRNHAPVPRVPEGTYRLRVDGLVENPLELSLQELEERFPAREVNATLQCAGNRRRELAGLGAIQAEVPWGPEALGTACWRGVALGDVLELAGVRPEARHAEFVGLDQVEKDGGCFGFGGSVPLSKAFSGEVLLAYEMNGAPLGPEHGAPLRALVPGYVGARSVKWLGRVELLAGISENYFQQRAYKRFPPEVTAQGADWASPEAEVIYEFAVHSVLCDPVEGSRLRRGPQRFSGYAVTSGDLTVERVEISADGGRTWMPAELGREEKWCWRLWSATLDLEPGERELVVRATDSCGRVQPADPRAVWNFKGYLNTAWHRVRVTVE
jgi:sulfite oxidase